MLAIPESLLFHPQALLLWFPPSSEKYLKGDFKWSKENNDFVLESRTG